MNEREVRDALKRAAPVLSGCSGGATSRSRLTAAANMAAQFPGEATRRRFPRAIEWC